MIRRIALLLAVLAVPRALPAQSAGGAIPAGTYDLDITFGGGTMEGVLHITTQDSLQASLDVGDHHSPVRVGARRGNHLALESTVPGMDVHYDLEFQGQNVTGTFRYNGNTGTIAGRRRAAGN